MLQPPHLCIYLAAVSSSLDVPGTHLVGLHPAVEVGRPVADLVLNHRESRLLQNAFSARPWGHSSEVTMRACSSVQFILPFVHVQVHMGHCNYCVVHSANDT